MNSIVHNQFYTSITKKFSNLEKISAANQTNENERLKSIKTMSPLIIGKESSKTTTSDHKNKRRGGGVKSINLFNTDNLHELTFSQDSIMNFFQSFLK